MSFFVYVISVILLNGISSETVNNISRDQDFCVVHDLQKDSGCVISTCNYTRADSIFGDKSDENIENHNVFEQNNILCKDAKSIFLQWNGSLLSNFIVEIRTEGENWKFANKTSCDFLTIFDLYPQQKYQIRLFEITREGTILSPLYSQWITTHPKNYMPSEVVKAGVKDLKLTESFYEATLEWTPADDIPCYYDVVWFVEDIMEHRYIKVKNGFEMNMTNLEMGKNYSVAIMATSNDFKRESKKVWFNFTVPSCLNTYHNLSMCVPPEPDNLQSNEILVYQENTTFFYDVNVEWSLPELMPDYYLVYIMPLQENSSELSLNLTGNCSNAYFSKVELSSHYQIMLYAGSAAGESKPAILYKHMPIRHIGTTLPRTYIVSIIIFLIILTITLLVYIIYRFIWTSQNEAFRRTEQVINSKYFVKRETYNEKYVSSFMNPALVVDIEEDEWKLDECVLKLDTVLGEGAFGIVRKGVMEKSKEEQVSVAIKMLKGNPSTEEISQFKQEMEIMKSVGRHPHLVSLEGCSYSANFGPLLIVEYCDKGDLKTYLNRFWEKCVKNSSSDSPYINVSQFHNSTRDNFFNILYQYEDEPVTDSKQLLSFARQIVLGMEYLSSLRVIHRDLAARNVLLCKDNTVKVADFGLSRDVYQDNIYLKKGIGRVPVKWMALESLSHAQYTIQSDVWSFGIVLWEIVTLGGDPYPGIPTHDLLRRLTNGYRMEQPPTCGDELYNIMQSCWHAVPTERPTFVNLREILEKLMTSDNHYLNIEHTN